MSPNTWFVLIECGVLYAAVGIPGTKELVLNSWFKKPRWSSESRFVVGVVIWPLWAPFLALMGLYYVARYSHRWAWDALTYIGRGFRDIYRHIRPARPPKVEVPRAEVYKRR